METVKQIKPEDIIGPLHSSSIIHRHQVTRAVVDVGVKQSAEKIHDPAPDRDDASIWQKLVKNDHTFTWFKSAQGRSQTGIPIRDDGTARRRPDMKIHG